VSKRRKEHWIERAANHVDEFFEPARNDSTALRNYVRNMARFCETANLTPYEMYCLIGSVTLPQAFCNSSKEIFIFDRDAAEMIGNTDGLPDLRDVLANVPYNTFAVDLGNGTGFIFTCGQAVFTLEQMFGKDSRDDSIWLENRPTEYVGADGEKMAFNWTPLDKEVCEQPRSRVCAANAREMMNDPSAQMDTALVENIVAYLCSINSEINTAYTPISTRSSASNRKKRTSAATWHEVGFHLGASIRAYRRYASAQTHDETHRQVRPHMRRAHWHHYWTGPRIGPRKLVLKWVAPTLVGADSAESLSATGHRIEVSA
jgi:hypothetical protein